MKSFVVGVALTLAAMAAAAALDFPESAAQACQPDNPSCGGN